MTEQEEIKHMKTQLDKLYAREYVNTLIITALLSGELTFAKFAELRDRTQANFLESHASEAVIDEVSAAFERYTLPVAAFHQRNNPGAK